MESSSILHTSEEIDSLPQILHPSNTIPWEHCIKFGKAKQVFAVKYLLLQQLIVAVGSRKF